MLPHSIRSFACLLLIASTDAGEWDRASSFTADLKAESLPDWEAATLHEMTDAIAAGTVPDATMRRYLLQDHLFLDAFSSLLAATISLIPKLSDRVPLAQFNALILGPENTYFERSFRGTLHTAPLAN